jgi:hypothetical protein
MGMARALKSSMGQGEGLDADYGEAMVQDVASVIAIVRPLLSSGSDIREVAKILADVEGWDAAMGLLPLAVPDDPYAMVRGMATIALTALRTEGVSRSAVRDRIAETDIHPLSIALGAVDPGWEEPRRADSMADARKLMAMFGLQWGPFRLGEPGWLNAPGLGMAGGEWPDGFRIVPVPLDLDGAHPGFSLPDGLRVGGSMNLSRPEGPSQFCANDWGIHHIPKDLVVEGNLLFESVVWDGIVPDDLVVRGTISFRNPNSYSVHDLYLIMEPSEWRKSANEALRLEAGGVDRRDARKRAFAEAKVIRTHM